MWLCLGTAFQPWSAVQAQLNTRVFEIRTYRAAEGKLDALHARFRDHTQALFTKHDMTSIGYFRPLDAPLEENTLIYILAHPSREAATKNWQAFHDDPEWQKRRRRQIRQSIVRFSPRGRRYLLRVIVDADGDDIRIVTVYRTSRVIRYWREA